MNRDNILIKIKLLLSLGSSPNANEAANAQALADKLIAKYNITTEELESTKEKPEKYGEGDLLYHSFSLISWMQRLALTCAKQFYCHIVQEELHPAVGDLQYKYYVYGDDEDANYVKFAFHTFVKKVNNLVETKCIARGPIYVSSYCEGVVQAIQANIEMDGIDIPEVKKPTRPVVQEEKLLNNGQSNLTQFKQQKEAPEEKTVDVNAGSLIKDVMAYFKGLEDGRRLSLQDILELEVENETAKELQSETGSEDGTSETRESEQNSD